MYSNKKLIKAGIYFLSLLCVFFIFTGCDKEDQRDATDSQGQVQNQEQTLETEQMDDRIYQIGETASTEELEITVTGVQKPTEWTRDPLEGHEYIVISVKLTNVSGEELKIGPSDFPCVKDQSGTRWGHQNLTGIRPDPDIFSTTDLAPGETFEGSLVFVVSTDIDRTEFQYQAEYAGTTPTFRFEIDLPDL